MAITKPPTGTVGWDDEVNAVIDRVNDMDTIGHYPLSAYGMHSASSNPDNTTLVTTFGPWMVRIWVPSGNAITKVGQVVTTVGEVGAGGLNGFAIYSDDGTSQIGLTANDETVWTTLGLRSLNLGTPIAAATTGRFVRVVANVQGFTSAPVVPFVVAAGSSEPGYTLNGNLTTMRRSAYLAPYSGSFPSSITPSSIGTSTNYLPLLFLG